MAGQKPREGSREDCSRQKKQQMQRPKTEWSLACGGTVKISVEGAESARRRGADEAGRPVNSQEDVGFSF